MKLAGLRTGAFWRIGVVLGLVTLSLLGCGQFRQMGARADDYDAYRKAKLSPTFEQRLRAGWYYLRAYPNGEFRPEVSSWFGPAEERYVNQAWQSRARLSSYLQLLPDGPHAGEVRRRLAELEAQARSEAAERASFLRRERDRQRAFDEASRSRAALRATVDQWLTRLIELSAYGKPRQEWDEAFQAEYFSKEPPALCDEQQCSKTLSVEFSLPTREGLRVERANFDIVLHLDRGTLTSATLRGHGLFSRLSESANLQGVGFDDLQARAEAIGTAVVVLSAMLEPLLPHKTCAGEAFSPTVLLRQCGGRKVEAIVGESFEQADRLEVTAVASPAVP